MAISVTANTDCIDGVISALSRARQTTIHVSDRRGAIYEAVHYLRQSIGNGPATAAVAEANRRLGKESGVYATMELMDARPCIGLRIEDSALRMVLTPGATPSKFEETSLYWRGDQTNTYLFTPIRGTDHWTRAGND
jgi:hypothetical protein